MIYIAGLSPRDIPYGEAWAGEITSAIQASRVMIFIFSEHSNQSEQVVREIQLGLKYGLTIITLRLTKEPYNRALEYYLSTLHWAQAEGPDDEAVLSAFVSQVKRYLQGEEMDPQPGSRLTLAKDSDFNIDAALDKRFEELFGENREKKEKTPVSPLRQRLLSRIGERYIENITNITDDEQINGKGPENNAPDSVSEGTFFTVSESEGRVMFFVVTREYQLPEYSISYRADPCIKEEKNAADGTRMATFIIPKDLEDREGGNALTMLTFLPDNKIMMVNAGIMDYQEKVVKLSKKPEPIELKPVHEEQDGAVRRVKADKDSSRIVIDPDTMQLVERYRHYDAETREWEYCMDIQPRKSYFAFDIRPSDEKQQASPYDIGRAYLNGTNGLPKNALDAAEWLDKAGTPEAYKLLAELFRTDPFLHSEEDAAYYEELAAEPSKS